MAAWYEAWTFNKSWDEMRDRTRFRQAFVCFSAHNIGAWPQPAEVLALLPLVEELKALPAKPTDPARAQAMIDDLARHLSK